MNNILYNFISPVTGYLLANPNYVLVGDEKGIATPSPLLLDVRLDLLDLSRSTNIALTADFIVGNPNVQVPNAQVLSLLANGIMINGGGTVLTVAALSINDLPNLPQNNIWIGDSSNRPVANPTLAVNNLALTQNYLWTGNSLNHPVEIADIAYDNMPNLTYNKIWIGNGSNRPIEGDPIPGPEGPEGPRGPRGRPGLSFEAIAKQIFETLFSSVLGSTLGGIFGSIAGDVVGELFQQWLNNLLAGTSGAAGLAGLAGAIGRIGLAGDKGSAGTAGLQGAKGAAGASTHVVQTNYDMLGNRIESLPSTFTTGDQVTTARLVWDILNDNIIIIWQ